MKSLPLALAMLLIGAATAVAQSAPPSALAPGPGSAGPKDPGSAVQHGAQPNSAEVRPGSRDGDSPSAAAGSLVRDPVERRILGLPVKAVLVIGGVLIALVVAAGLLVPSARRRSRARGNGTYGCR
jgi:hypothetical protein